EIPDDDPNKTLGAGQNRMVQVQRMAQVLEAARRRGRGPAQMTEEERQTLHMLEWADKPEEHARQTARLQHLCRLMVRDRRPECPLNGILVLVPFAALLNNEDAEKTSLDCKHDLQAAWEVFQMHCPLLALVCDLETAPGFADFLEGYLAHCKSEEERRRERKRRLGRRFGWGGGVESKARAGVVGEEVGWVGQGMFPTQVYLNNLLRLENPDREDVGEVVRRNGRLCRFMGVMRDGQRRLSKIVSQGLESKSR